MKTKFHIEITRDVLNQYFNQDVPKNIIRSNILQDRLKNQFGHDYIHFDSNAFIEGFEYISQQEKSLYQSLSAGDLEQAWKSLGRILHSWQDFYSHSNYVHIWLKKTENPDPQKINHADPEIMRSPVLQSGKNYGIIEFIALIPGVSLFVKPFMPPDSHAKMNLDSPKSGSAFKYAYSAAKKRTDDVIGQVLHHINGMETGEEKLRTFLGK